MKTGRVLPQLDVKNTIRSLKDEHVSPKEIAKTEKDVQLERYAEFFKKNLAELASYMDFDYTALEIVNDEGLVVTNYMKEIPNFKVCHASLIDTLIGSPAKLSQVNLVHAVMPFDDACSLVYLLKQVPEVTNAQTRVILGAYDNYDEIDHEQNRRVLRGLMNGLDFCEYKADDIDGTCVRMVYSTYQKNMRMRH